MFYAIWKGSPDIVVHKIPEHTMTFSIDRFTGSQSKTDVKRKIITEGETDNGHKDRFTTGDWLSYLDGSLLPPQPPARPVSPFIPKDMHQALNLLKMCASLGLSLLRRKPVIWGNPVIAHIEPTSLCNLSCPLCPAGNGGLTRVRERIDLDTFKRIIDKLPDTIRMILLWNQGEPFIVKQLPQMIRYLKQRNVYVVTSTNGHYFRKDGIVKQVVESGLDEIIVSLDGADQEVYEKYRVGGKLKWVFEGIQRLVKWKRELNSPTPLIHLQFILMRQNAHQRGDMIELGRKLGADRLSFKTLQVTDYQGSEDYLPDDPAITRYTGKTEEGKYVTRKRKFFPDHCLRLWYSLVVNCDGRVSPCCFDKDGDYALGNLIEEPFYTIWRGDAHQKFRQHLLIDRYDLDMCNDCTEGLKELFVQTVDYNRERRRRSQ